MQATIIFSAAAILAVVCVICLVRTKKKVREVTEDSKLPFPVKSTIFPNAFQSVVFYDSSQIKPIESVFTTITLRRFPDPIYLFSSEKEDELVINLTTSFRSPNFYIHKKGFNLTHAGKKLSKPLLLNNTDYKIHGIVTDEIIKFCQKYNFIYFYSSYFPADLFDKNEKSNAVEFKMLLKNLKGDLLSDFVNIFSNISKEQEAKFLRLEKEFEILRNEKKAYENLGYFEKMKREIKSNNK